MKKLVSVLVALMLCLTAVAMAESVPSKTTDDMTVIDASAENMPADSNFAISAQLTQETEEAKEHRAACQTEIDKLKNSASVAEYFGEVKNAAGEVVSLSDVLGTDTLNVFEFVPLTVENYKEEYGKVSANMIFATPYTPGDKVLVMIGLVTVAEDGTQSVEWTMFEGTALDNGDNTFGCINVELDPATMMTIQNNTAVMSVVSK